ncbi:hypothetical protein ACFL1A_02975 [Patescibacteria group bacterium]
MRKLYLFILIKVFVILLLFNAPGSVFAQNPEETFQVPPNNVIIGADVVDDRFDISYPLAGAIQITEGTPIGNVVARFASRIWPTNNQHDVDDLNASGFQYDGAKHALTFKALDEVTIHCADPQMRTYTSRICSRDPVTGAIDVNQTSLERIYTDFMDWVRFLFENTKKYNAYYNFKAPIPNMDFNCPTELVDLPSAAECEETDDGTNIVEYTEPTHLYNAYTQGGGQVSSSPIDPSPFGNIVGDILNYFIPIEAWILMNARDPYNEFRDCNSGKCYADDMPKSPLPRAQLDILEERDGLSSTYKPQALSIKPELTHSEHANSFTSGSNTQNIDSHYQNEDDQKSHLYTMDCLRLPKALVEQLPSDRRQFCKDIGTNSLEQANAASAN